MRLISIVLGALFIALVVRGAQPPAAKVVAPQNRAVATPWRPDDIGTLVDKLLVGGGARPKGEFETTEEFDKKVEALLRANSTDLRFELPSASLELESLDEERLTYDADSQTVTVRLRPSSIILYDDYSIPSFQSFKIKSRTTRKSTYLGMNAFGVMKTITLIERDDFGIALSRASRVTDKPWVAMEGVTPAIARALKPSLRVCLKGKLADSHVYRDSDHTDPTISSPYKVKSRKFYLLFDLEEIQLIDSRNGRVLASNNGGQGKP